jgi:hypothetical protein
MNWVSRRFVVLAALVLASVLLMPSLVSAQMRYFSGRIDKISKKKMIVDNRMGDKVSFVPADTIKLSGIDPEKKEWGDLKAKDWVKVAWKFTDKPRKAYEIEVLPTPEEEE